MCRLNKEQQELAELERQFSLHKTESGHKEKAVENDVERLQEKAKAKEVAKEKPEGYLGMLNN